MKGIELEHPEYRLRSEMLRRYRDLYVGGEQIKANAAEYLTRRQKEPLSVYGERLQRVFYENYIGSILDWYAATLFRREPILLLDGNDVRAKRFFGDLAEDCDLRGTSLAEFFRREILDALITGASYVLVDFPRCETVPATLAEEDRSGTSRAYLTHCRPEQLINWSCDDRGAFNWVVLRTESLQRATVDAEVRKEVLWHYYDRENYAVYRKVEGGTYGGPALVSQGRHGLASLRQVPLFGLEIPEGLWLMNRAGLLQLEHFNKSNALSWALTQGLYATPVVFSDKQWKDVVGESYYIQLGPNDKFGWTEPEGRVYQIAADNLTRLQGEIYRVCYLLSQAGGPLSGVSASGLSKQRDFAITQEVLRALGDSVKDVMKRVLRAIAAVRQDDVAVDVSGLDEFDIGDFSGELEDAERLLELAKSSPTLKKQVLKKLAFKFLCDVRQEMKDRIAQEIEEGVE